MGDAMPPPQRGRLPFYNQSKLQTLQDEADHLEALGVLGKPEDVGVEVKHVSPSFLIKKPAGGFRFITSFSGLCRYTRVPPTKLTTCNEVIHRLASWKYMVKTDLTKSYYQIQVTKSSIPFLGTLTPYKGLRVYLRSANGQPGASEALQELTSRVYGDFLQEGFILILADDMYICGNTIDELHNNWTRTLQRSKDNNLKLSPTKTVICPKKTTVLGWIWDSGTLSASPHKIAPLATVDYPVTCTSMRSFLGAYKAIARCIPRYSSLMSPLEDSIKGLTGAERITWTEELRASFDKAQSKLKETKTLTIPRPTDSLVITVDASPSNNGIGATMYVIREGKRYIAEFFSFKLKSHQQGWLPCELEALAIGASVNHFSPLIRESTTPAQILSDNKPCVQAFEKLCNGQFSNSSRVSTFLSVLSAHNITLTHLKGSANTTSDFSSRNPQVCHEATCQVCKFVNNLPTSVVSSVSVADILSGKSVMPYLNPSAWKSAQQDSSTLRRAYAHLTKGTRPGKREKNIGELRRYLRVASVDRNGLLIVKKSDAFVQERKLTIIPKEVLPGLVTALHIQLKHPTKHQLKKLFNRFFYGLNSSSVVNSVIESCDQCESMKKLPKEVIEQSSTPTPNKPGTLFFADVLRRCRQKIFVARDVFSSFTVASIIPNEKHETLRSAVISNTSLFKIQPTTVHADSASGFKTLKNDHQLRMNGISLELGYVKNPNKNSVIDKAIQELELELLKIEPKSAPISNETLQSSVSTLNHRIRNRGLSAYEILFQRDQVSGAQISFDDELLVVEQKETRMKNHPLSARSKAKCGELPTSHNFKVGDLVFVKHEGDKLNARERYIITELDRNNVIIQKLSGTRFSSIKYKLPVTSIFPVVRTNDKPYHEWGRTKEISSDDTSDDTSDEDQPAGEQIPHPENEEVDDIEGDDEDTPDDSDVDDVDLTTATRDTTNHTRPRRERRRPPWHDDYVPH